MSLVEATEIVREHQNAYLRGQLDPEVKSWLQEMYPQAIPDWDRMKVNMIVKKNKLSHKAKNILLGGANKSNGCHRFRPGKQVSTLKNQEKQLAKTKREFYAAGLPVLVSWAEFMNDVSISMGGPKCW